MRKYIRFATLIIVLFLLSACTQVQPQATAEITPTPIEKTVTSTPKPSTSTLDEAIKPEEDHQECTHIEAHNCDIDTSEYVVQAETTETEQAPPMETVHIVDKLLLDYEIIFYQSEFEGETVQLSEVFANGKPTVMVYWAGLCPVCRREMPEIQAAHETYGDQVNFVGIDVGLFTNLGSKQDALNMIEDLELTFALGVTLDYTVLPTYEVVAVPTTLFMKPDGQIIRKESTLLNQEDLFERIDTLLEHSQG